jgi:hypothetical protein
MGAFLLPFFQLSHFPKREGERAMHYAAEPET